jgi:exopolysaccharide biosynthesis polyprenyl glycosylphosphotransferase
MHPPPTSLLAQRAIDLACVALALSAAGLWRSPTGTEASTVAQLVVLGLFLGTWTIVAHRLRTHGVAPGRNLARALRRGVETWAATWGLAGLLAISSIDDLGLDIWQTLVFGAAAIVFVRLVATLTPFGFATDRPRAVVVGACASARALTSSREIEESLDVVGFLPFAGEDAEWMPHLRQLGTAENAAKVLVDEGIDVALVSPSDRAVTGDVHKVFFTCDELGLQTQYFPSFLDVDHLRVGLTWRSQRPGLNLERTPEVSLAHMTKRALDVIGSSIGILLLLPVFLVCALAVKLTSRGPVLFLQPRVGQGGRTFSCLKFRTMRVGAHAQQALLRPASQQDGPAFKMSRDPRVTPVGRLLRKFSLDELPQMFNVLIGDMSLVGPRPPIPSEVDNYTWWQRRRISVKPGLTCVWQVYGRNRVSFKRWVEMDLYYIDNWSLWLDIKLIAHTFGVVLRGTGM